MKRNSREGKFLSKYLYLLDYADVRTDTINLQPSLQNTFEIGLSGASHILELLVIQGADTTLMNERHLIRLPS